MIVKKFYSTSEAARIFDCDQRTILRWIQSGKFPNAILLPNGHVIPQPDIEAEQQRKAIKVASAT